MNNSFLSDYNQLCHEEVYDYVGNHIHSEQPGYMEDYFCTLATKKIRNRFKAESSDVYFFVGGTQTNLTMISHMLHSPYEAVIATKYAHIKVHEAGAIAGTGHQIIEGEDIDGKILPESIEKICLEHKQDKHMVLPKLVFISNPTEVGTLYSLDELKAIREVCQKHDLYLYLDGARLFVAATSTFNDIELSDYAKYTDAFYIGGTKHGLMLGEAAVINNDEFKPHFFRHMKSKGAVLAKSGLIGLNFCSLFYYDLYDHIGRTANETAVIMVDELKKRGYTFAYPPMSNQIFLNIPEDEVEALSKKYAFADLGYLDKDNPTLKTIRLVTSFSTEDEYVYEFIKVLDFIKIKLAETEYIEND